MKIKEAIARGDVVTGEEEFNFFLAVLFPSDQLLCMEYNRVVRDLAGFSVSPAEANRRILVSVLPQRGTGLVANVGSMYLLGCSRVGGVFV